MCPSILSALANIKGLLRKVKAKVLNFQRGTVQERSDPGVVVNVPAASCSVSRDDQRNESTTTAGVNHVIRTCSPAPINAAAAQDHHDRCPPMISVHPQPGLSPPGYGAIATTTHHLHAPRDGIVLHTNSPVMVVTDDISSPSDFGSNVFHHGNLRSLSMDDPSPCLCSHVRGAGRTISFMGEAPFDAAYSEGTSSHHTTYPMHDLPNCSCALHSTYGRWPAPSVTPYPPPHCMLSPIQRHDVQSYLNDPEFLQTNPSPHIWGAPPSRCCPHHGPWYTSPAASHQLQSTCGTHCLAHSPQILQANDIGSSRRLPSRSYSNGSLHSHSTHASPPLTRSRSVLVGHAPSRATLSTIVTSPFPPPPPTTRSDAPPPRRDDSQTTAEAGCEKLSTGG